MKRGAEDDALNPQIHMLPVLGDQTAEKTFMRTTASEAGVNENDILGTDLYLYNRMPGTVWGANGEFM